MAADIGALVKRAVFLALAAGGFAGTAWAGTVEMPAPVAVIYPGQTIDPAALSDVEFDVGSSVNLALYAREARQLVGKVAVSTLLPGRAIELDAVRDRYLVQRGQVAAIVFRAGGLDIRASGVPVESGGEGDVIRVRNADSGQIISGTVLADGSVRVGQN